MLSYYDLMKPMLNAGCQTKGTGEGRWKAKTPNQTISFGYDSIGYHEYVDRSEDIMEPTERPRRRKENIEFVILSTFIDKVELNEEEKIFSITNKLGEKYEWKLVV